MTTIADLASQYGTTTQDIKTRLGLKKDASDDTVLSKTQVDAIQKALGTLDPSDRENSMDTISIDDRKKAIDEQNFQALYGNPDYVAAMRKAKQKSGWEEFGDFLKFCAQPIVDIWNAIF